MDLKGMVRWLFDKHRKYFICEINHDTLFFPHPKYDDIVKEVRENTGITVWAEDLYMYIDAPKDIKNILPMLYQKYGKRNVLYELARQFKKNNFLLTKEEYWQNYMCG